MFTRCCRTLESLRREALSILVERHLDEIDTSLLSDIQVLNKLEHVRFVKQFPNSNGPFRGSMCMHAFWKFEVDCFKLEHDDLYVVYAGGRLWGFGKIEANNLSIIADIYDNDLLKRYVL